MDQGLDSPISQHGRNLSGGQKQRIGIARAVCKRPDIYIFDDSFSALDFRTDRALRSALRQRTKDSTVIIVAQRVGTIMDADRIVVMDGGEIVGIGTHDELMESCPLYNSIAKMQFSEVA
jgi:ABC-type multidrug transport system fused ATPase/permease subunit